jgi:hypothetical protein
LKETRRAQRSEHVSMLFKSRRAHIDCHDIGGRRSAVLKNMDGAVTPSS